MLSGWKTHRETIWWNAFKKNPQQEIFSVLWQAIPGPPVHPGHPVSPLPSSHDFSDRIGFFRELLVMATLSKVLFRSQAKREDDLATKDYLFTFARWNRWRLQQRCLRLFFPLADSWKLEGGLNFWRQACGAHGGWEVTSGFLCMCAVCSPQAVTCGFNPLYEDRLPSLICTLSPHEPSMVSLYLSHQLYLGSLSCISGISLPVFYLANNFVSPYSFTFFPW